MEMVTLPAAVLFGTMIGLGVTGFLLAKETRPWYVLLAHLSIRSDDGCERIAR